MAHAISNTMAATPATQSNTRDSSPASGAAHDRNEPSRARGLASESGVIRGLSGRCAFRLWTNAFVRSAAGAASDTPARRRTMISVQSHVYVVR